MNTMSGYVVQQATASTDKIMQSILLLARNLMRVFGPNEQTFRVWQGGHAMPNVPLRVWKRHSALLTLMMEQAEHSSRIPHREVEESACN